MSNEMGHILMTILLIGIVTLGFSTFYGNLMSNYNPTTNGLSMSNNSFYNATLGVEELSKNISDTFNSPDFQVTDNSGNIIITGGLSVLRMFYVIPNLIIGIFKLVADSLMIPYQVLVAAVVMVTLLIGLAIVYAVFKVRP